MTPGINNGISDEGNIERHIERQMGCMAGFRQLFDRHQYLSGKRFYSPKRIPSSPTTDSLSPSERSNVSSTSFVKAAPPSPSSTSPESYPSSPDNYHPARPSLPLPLPVFEMKDGVKTSWKLREAPRLSLDSRAVVDAKGKLRPREIRTTPAIFNGDPSDCSDVGDDRDQQRRSPSVVARLMGLESLPTGCIEEQPKRSELRRSASESRVSRDLSQFNCQKFSPIMSVELFRPQKDDCSKVRLRDSKPKPRHAPTVSLQRKSFFEAQEFFAEPKRTESIFCEIEKRLRMRGVEEPAKDMETLKQILEALQLTGLLHTKPSELPAIGSLNGTYNHWSPISAINESPIIDMKPPPKHLSRSTGSKQFHMQHRSVSPRVPASPEPIQSVKYRREPVCRSLMKPPELNDLWRSPINSPVRRRPINSEGQTASYPERAIPAIHSPRTSPKRAGSDQAGSLSPRIQRPKREISPKESMSSLAEDDASTFSETSILSSRPQFDFELQSVSTEEYRTERSLLERCDKLLHSIAAITSSAEHFTATDLQPSPVSVLDSSFLSEESSASPLPKRSIDFKEQISDSEDHRKRKATPTARSEFRNGPEEIGAGQDDDYTYVADVVRETDRETDRWGYPDDVFSSLEQRYRSAGSSIASVLHRRLVFDTVTEIIDRKRNTTPWAAFTSSFSAAFANMESSMLSEVWEEVCLLQEPVTTENIMDLAGKVIKQDMAVTAAGEQEWAVPEVDMSAAVLHIERQIFKDLVGDTIRELADLASRHCSPALPCRKLIF